MLKLENSALKSSEEESHEQGSTRGESTKERNGQSLEPDVRREPLKETELNTEDLSSPGKTSQSPRDEHRGQDETSRRQPGELRGTRIETAARNSVPSVVRCSRRRSGRQPPRR